MPLKINVGLVALAALVTAVLADPSVDRRASMGFMGMRGKKDRDQGGGGDETSAAVDLDKRTMVFRRPLFDGGHRPTAIGIGGGYAEGFKRASMGFMGMRGKKDYYNKGPASGFFGMRGKKVPSADSFYGVRGKKWTDHAAASTLDAVDVDVERSAIFVLYRIIDELMSDLSDRGERILLYIIMLSCAVHRRLST